VKYGLLRRSSLFKVIKVGANRKPVCDLLLVINSSLTDIRSRTISVLSQLIFRILYTAFLSHTLGAGGLGTTYDVHLWLIGKRVVSFLLVLIKLSSPGVTDEARRTKIDRQSAISLQRDHSLTQNFGYKGSPPPVILKCIVRPKNALQLCH